MESTQTSRERVIKAITFQSPDRVPIMHQMLLAARFKHGRQLEKILEKYPNDFAYCTSSVVHDTHVDIQKVSKHWDMKTMEYTDEWGCVW